jgi:hypothetical protein
MLLVVFFGFGTLTIVDAIDSVLNAAVGHLALLVHNSIHAVLQVSLHIALAAFEEVLNSGAALITQAGHCTLEARCLFEYLINFLLRFQTKNFLDLVSRARIDLGEERDWLALHEFLQGNHIIDVYLV